MESVNFSILTEPTLNFKDFVSHPDWYLQPLKVLSFTETNITMPEAFTRNTEPYGSAALWTLRDEILAYLGTWLIFLIGGLSRKWMIAAQFILPSLVWVIGHHYGVFERLPATFEGLARFGIAYGLGATLYAYRGLLRFNMFFVVLFLTLCWLVKAHTPILEVAMNLALAWAVMLTAYASAPKLAWTQRLPDLSYGIYIYHWVILQSLFYFFPELTLWVLICAAYGLTLILASFSWYVIEKPSLNYKPVMTRLIEKSIGRRAEPSRG